MISTVQEILGTNDLSGFSITQLKLINLLNDNGPMHRDQICEALGFEQYDYEYIKKYTRTGTMIHQKQVITQYKKRTTVYDDLTKLQKRKIVEKFSKKNGKRGRPPVYFKLK